jgi:hypothetical protein
MAKTRYRKRTRRLRTRKYKRGGAPTAEQIKKTYSKRHWNSRPAALVVPKSPSSSEERIRIAAIKKFTTGRTTRSKHAEYFKKK